MQTLTYAVEQAEQIRDALGSAVGNVEAAIEVEVQTRQTRRTLEELYDGAEAELVSLAMVDGRIDGKNAETRKAQVDALLVAERSGGELRDLWRDRNKAIDAHEEAQASLEQCKARHSATRHAADLTAAMLMFRNTFDLH